MLLTITTGVHNRPVPGVTMCGKLNQKRGPAVTLIMHVLDMPRMLWLIGDLLNIYKPLS